jgi:hypothetical protein
VFACSWISSVGAFLSIIDVGCQQLLICFVYLVCAFLVAVNREREVCYRGGQAIALERVTCPSFSSHIMRTR